MISFARTMYPQQAPDAIGTAALKLSQAPVVPDYDLLDCIGEGSYGEIWLARNAFGTLRAVKIVKRANFSNDRPFEREFDGIRKFESISHSHSSQLALFHVGRSKPGDFFYYVMELADDARACSAGREPGGNSEAIQSNEPPDRGYSPHTLRHDLQCHGRLLPRQVLEIGLGLGEALAHLHSFGLVHRDIKPSNIIFVAGRPKLADIGLVTGQSDECSIVGTEGYLAPEGPGTPQADVFALGKVLYEALTGEDRHHYPEMPADMSLWPDQRMAFELNEVILKACAPDRARRYRSADEMNADLKLLLEGHSLQQRRIVKSRLRKAKQALPVALLLASALGLFHFSPDRSRPAAALLTSKVEGANDAYSDAWGWFHKDTADAVERSIKLFKEAISLDPNFARAHAGLAYAYAWHSASGNWLLLREGEREARKALALGFRSGEAHWPIGAALALLDHNWKAAEREFDEALRLSPDSPDVLLQYANYLVWANRIEEAKEPLEKALRAESPSVLRVQNAAFLLLATRQYSRAVKKAQEVIDKEPSTLSNLIWFILAPAALEQGKYMEAIDLCERAELLSGKSPDEVRQSFDDLRAAYQESGATGYWRHLLKRAQGSREPDYLLLAAMYARTGQSTNALSCLRNALENRPVDVAFRVTWDPDFDSLRGDAGFSELLHKLNL